MPLRTPALTASGTRKTPSRPPRVASFGLTKLASEYYHHGIIYQAVGFGHPFERSNMQKVHFIVGFLKWRSRRDAVEVGFVVAARNDEDASRIEREDAAEI